MKTLISCILTMIFCGAGVAAPKVTIETVTVLVTEKGKEPVKVSMPYWVAKNSAEVTDKLKVGTEELPMKQIIQVIDNAPKLGPVITIEEGDQKIEISIE